MAIGLWISFADGNEQQYDAVNDQMGIEESPPDGLIFHAAGDFGDGNWSVIDFWESREHFDRFLGERLGPAIQQLGDQAPPGPPNIKEFSVSNFIKP